MITPNRLTIGRIGAAPLIFGLVFLEHLAAQFLAFFLFLVAAVSDIIDGRLARRRAQVTDFGQLADPLADKLILAAGFVAFYLKNDLALWIVVVVLGREVLVTAFRYLARSRGMVIPAGPLGKWKTGFQMFFIGAVLLKYVIVTVGRGGPSETLPYQAWMAFHNWVIDLTIWVVVLFTLMSLGDYLLQNRRVALGGTP